MFPSFFQFFKRISLSRHVFLIHEKSQRKGKSDRELVLRDLQYAIWLKDTFVPKSREGVSDVKDA